MKVFRYAAVAAAMFFAGAVAAQDFPSAGKTVRIIVPFPAGGTTDVVARIVADKMSQSMKTPVVVENRGGAGGSLGADAVAKAAPDGYTMLMHNVTFTTTSAALGRAGKLPHDLEKDFAPVSLSVNVPFVLFVHPDVPAKDLREMVTLLQKDRSLKYNYGSTGPGSAMNIMGELLKRDASIEMEHIPFRGAAPLMAELIAGRLHFGGDQLSSSVTHINAGKARPVATTSSQRIRAFPNIPTVRELGFQRMEIEGWNGLFAPAKTPEPILARLSQEASAAVKHADVQKRFEELAAEPVGSDPARLREVVVGQYKHFQTLVEQLGITME